MFARAYFPGVYFAPTYFPPIPAANDEYHPFGGRFAKRRRIRYSDRLLFEAYYASLVSKAPARARPKVTAAAMAAAIDAELHVVARAGKADEREAAKAELHKRQYWAAFMALALSMYN